MDKYERIKQKYERDAKIGKKDLSFNMKMASRERQMKLTGKPLEAKKTIKRLFKYISKDRFLLIFALFLAVIGVLSSLLISYFLKPIIDDFIDINNGSTLSTSERIAKLEFWLIILSSFSALCFIGQYLSRRIMLSISQNSLKRMRNDLYYKLEKLPISYFDKNQTGDIISRFTNDVDNIGFTMTQSLSSIVGSSTLLVGSLIMMFYTNWILAITAVLSTIIGLVFVVIIIFKSQKYFNEVQKSLGEINGHIEETFSGHNVIKVYNAEEEMNDKFDKINEHLFECGRKSQFLSGLMHPLMGFTGNFGYVIVCVVGSILVMNKTIDFGVIVAFMMYI